MQEQLAAGVSALHAVKVAFIDMDGSPLISTAAASCLAGCRSRRHSIALGCPGLLHPRREARPALEAHLVRVQGKDRAQHDDAVPGAHQDPRHEELRGKRDACACAAAAEPARALRTGAVAGRPARRGAARRWPSSSRSLATCRLGCTAGAQLQKEPDCPRAPGWRRQRMPGPAEQALQRYGCSRGRRGRGHAPAQANRRVCVSRAARRQPSACNSGVVPSKYTGMAAPNSAMRLPYRPSAQLARPSAWWSRMPAGSGARRALSGPRGRLMHRVWGSAGPAADQDACGQDVMSPWPARRTAGAPGPG